MEKPILLQMESKKYVESMTQSGFMFFVNCIFDILQYKVIKSNDVRKIDILEKICGMESTVSYGITKNGGSAKYYSHIVEAYIDEFIKCSGRAEIYKIKCKNIAKKINEEKGEVPDRDLLVDETMILFSMFRYMPGSIEKCKDITISDADFTFEPEDGDLLQEIIKSKYLVPFEFVAPQKNMFNSFMDTFKSTSLLQIEEDVTRMHGLRFFYIYSAIFLTLGLQDRGFFV